MAPVNLQRFGELITKLERANHAQLTAAALITPKNKARQPSQVMYGGAHLLNENTFSKISKLAIEAFEFAAPNASALRDIVSEPWSDEFTSNIYKLISRKVESDALEDYRIDFEDGYGMRSDEEEDHHASLAAKLVVELATKKKLPQSVGIRIKPLSTVGMRRSLRTLDIFVRNFSNAGAKTCGLNRFLITLPKVSNAEQVSSLVEILNSYESEYNLPAGFFGIEILIETPDAFLALDGSIPINKFLFAAKGRCQSLHFGVYDFTSSLGIGSAGQSIDHVACDFARMWMLIISGLAPGLAVSDGIINRLPLVPREIAPASMQQFKDAWQYNYRQMTRSLNLGFYQGWDLHPSQLPVRHVANYAFVLKEFDHAAKRLKMFAEKASQASHVGGVFDDRASVLGLLNFFDRALASGVLSEQDLLNAGINLDDIKNAI